MEACRFGLQIILRQFTTRTLLHSRYFHSSYRNETAFVPNSVESVSPQSSSGRFPRQHCPHSTVAACVKQHHLKFSSQLYTPPEEGEHVPFVLKPDLDFDAILRNRDLFQESIEARKLVDINISSMVSLWEEARLLEAEKTKLEKAQNSLNIHAKELSKQKGGKTEEKEKIRLEGRRIRDAVKKVNSSLNDVMMKLYPLALSLPNLMHNQVPRTGEDRVLETLGCPEMRDCNLSGEHKYQLTEHPLVHPGYGYVRGNLVLREMDILSAISSQLTSRGFTQLSMPDMFKPIALEALGISAEESKETYAIETSESLMHLSGTSPMGFLAYFMMSVLEAGDLPQRLFAVGRHYNASAETPYFQALHQQFQDTRIELFGVCEGSPVASNALLAQYIDTIKENLSNFGLPFRIVDVASNRLLPCMHRMVAMEIWMPKESRYVEVANICSCTDFISRRLKIRYPTNPRESASQSRGRAFAHTIHGTALKSSVLLSALMQHERPLP